MSALTRFARRPPVHIASITMLLVATGAVLSVGMAADAGFRTVRLLPGSGWTDPQGAVWKGDSTCAGGVVRNSTHGIAGTGADRLYQRQRTGVTGCSIPVRQGLTYRVTLYLAETDPSPTHRVFDVLAQGRVRVPALDIATRAGGPYRATQVDFDVPVTGTRLELRFRPASRLAKVSAIRVSQAPASGSAPSPRSMPTTTPRAAPAAGQPGTTTASGYPAEPTSEPAGPTATPRARPTPTSSPGPSGQPERSGAPAPTSVPAPASTPYTLDASYDRPSKDKPSDYRQHVDFNIRCDASHVSADDPIVYPGEPGKAHQHVFAGNRTTSAASTQDSLDSGKTNCRLDRDRAAYWVPQLYDESGSPLTPSLFRAYYRVGTLGKVATIPHGLRVIAGNGKATSPQDKAIAGWQCRSVKPDTQTVPKQATIPDCPRSDQLEGSVVFPNCWNGYQLDSPDHASHLSYGQGDSCDSAHPVRLPQLTLAFRFSPGTTSSRSYLSSGSSGLTLHADFWNAWDAKTLDALVQRCLNDGVHCGDVSPKHFPGPMP